MDNKRYDLSNVLITGASGNVGKTICSILKQNKIKYKRLSDYHKNKKFPLENIKLVQKFQNSST